MEGCSKRTAGAESGIPDDPLLNILSRVPGKSVCRFKCVSKAWRDLIDDPDNRKKLRQAMQGLFVLTREVSVVDNTKVARATSLSFIDLMTMRSMPLDMEPSFSFLTEMTGIKTFLLDSCNGLILLGHCQEPADPFYYTVCNPTTKQLSKVPACGSVEAKGHTYLAYDPTVSSHFHLVQFEVTDEEEEIVSLHVYSSETGTWSQNQIDEQEKQGQLESWHHQFTLEVLKYRAFINGFLHMIVWGSHGQHILAVDIQGKARRMITVPSMADHGVTTYLGESQGHLHCVTQDSEDKELCIWVLQDYDTQEWVLKNSVDLESLDFGMTEFEVVEFHQDCNVVFFLQDFCKLCKLIAYNMDRKEVSVIATFKDHKDPWDFACYIPCFSESPDPTNKY